MKCYENHFTSHDGTELFYRHWCPQQKSDRAIIMFHRGHEHSDRWHDVIKKLDLDSYNFFAWDARGHGRSPGERGYADSYDTLVQDVDAFVAHIATSHEIAYENIVIFAHSVGSVLASTWVHDYAPNIRGMVLGSPALRVRLYAPFAIPVLRFLNKIRSKSFISSYVKGRLLTHDPEKIQSYNNDPLITPQIAVNVLLGLYDASTRLIADAAAITTPTLVLTSGDDFVVKQSAQKTFYDRLSHPRKEMQTFEGFRHDTFNEADNHLPLNKARLFIQDLFDCNYDAPSMITADKYGYTKAEHDQLSSRLPWWSVKKWNFTLSRFGLATVGRLSKGIRVGWKTGFDSGTMLDYVYKNTAQGISPLGRAIDRQFLNSPGWRGIRQRKINLEKLLKQQINERLDRNQDVRIIDIATGHGRYVLDVLETYDQNKVSALLRDYCDVNITAGARLAKDRKIDNVRFVEGNAFDRESLKQITNLPNIGIVSGLYELFTDNDMIRTSLAGLYDALEPGASLIYTNQPWHPQLEFIARVLTSHRDGDGWVMRRRTQQEMDELVKEAGFEKITQKIDEQGIFSVSVARKPY
jgi:alpha-beta hydrolase superfamily lysophospholipase/SAM-dependent methyltransferase